MVDFNLSGKVALVTGGSKGIGYAIGKGMAKAGANIILASRHLSEAEEAAKSLTKLGVKTAGIRVDIQDIAQAQTAVDETVRRFGKIDILVNNAGVAIHTPALEVTEKIWDTILHTNLKGLFFSAQAAARAMVKQGKGGRIINIASVGSIVAQRNQAPYGASKGGVIQLTRVLAVEWAVYNILVNAIGPGSIRTDMNREYLANPKNLQYNLGKIPLGRIGMPDEVAGAAVFLASEAASYVTGQTFYIDGGWTLE